MEIRLGSIESSFKKTTRTREKSPFYAEIAKAVEALAEGQAVFVSHKQWLASLSPEVRANLKPTSEKNGPRYTLKGMGILAVAGNLSGDELQEQAEVEGRELSENDIIYRCSKLEQVQ